MAENTLRQIVGLQVRYYRLVLRLSQKDLAMLSGLNRSYVGGIERGERNIGIDNLEKIARGVDVEPWKLLQDGK